MKIIDTFIWCNAYEKDLLWLKFYLEQNKVDEWILAHCSHDYHGRFKGDTVSEVLKEDRFAPFLSKLKVIYIDRNLSADPSLAKHIDPHQYANAEWELRDASTKYILDQHVDQDRILVTDVDEIFDFSDSDRSDRILAELETDDPIQFDRVRYIFDFDNRAFRDVCDMVSPSYKVGHLKQGVAKLRDKKWIGRQVGNGSNPLIFEYCHCFSYDGYISKHMSSLHTQWSVKKLNQALEWNIWPQTDYQHGPDKNNRWHWFKQVNLHANNSPQYIRDNLQKLKTNLVNQDYIHNRQSTFGFDGNFIESQDFNDN